MLVNRCGSTICPNGKECVATKSRTVIKPIMVMDYNNDNAIDCYYLRIKEDVRCGCKCMKTEKDCNNRQTFVKSKCSCECSDKVSLTLPGLIIFDMAHFF